MEYSIEVRKERINGSGSMVIDPSATFVSGSGVWTFSGANGSLAADVIVFERLTLIGSLSYSAASAAVEGGVARITIGTLVGPGVLKLNSVGWPNGIVTTAVQS